MIQTANQPENHSAYRDIVGRVEKRTLQQNRQQNDVCLVVVSKTHAIDKISPVIEAGARNFGENRVQEAQKKWPILKRQYDAIKLHLIGPLQSNKAREAVQLFDVIHTIDREKIAVAISNEMKRQNKVLQLFVQVNTGEEAQKAGVSPRDAEKFVARCRDVHGLEISGLMCIPPFDAPPDSHFKLLAHLAEKCGCKNLSMGMSGDFEVAIDFGATHVRVGSAVFGVRT